MLLWALPLCITITWSCTGFNKLVKSNNYEAQYKAAQKYYDEGSYSRAGQLLEGLQLHFRNQEQSENIAWLYAQCLYKQKGYYLAAYQYQTFARRYPYSSHAEEAAFLSAYCKYRDIPPSSLDQSLTRETITEFERFADRYPQSAHIPEVNSYLDELEKTLIKKDYDIAVGYYTTEAYHAAYVALNNFLAKHPESEYREEAMYYIIRSGYEYAINSREDKIKERLQIVVNDFDKFAVTFSNSKHLSSAQDIYTQCRAKMAAIDETNSKQ